MNEEKNMNWKDQDPWGLKEFQLMMILEFVFVIGCIKFLVKPIYSQWSDNEVYSGTLIGLKIAIVLVSGVYFMILRLKKLSWSEVRIRSFSIKDWKFIVLLTIKLMAGGIIHGLTNVIMVLLTIMG